MRYHTTYFTHDRDVVDSASYTPSWTLSLVNSQIVDCTSLICIVFACGKSTGSVAMFNIVSEWLGAIAESSPALRGKQPGRTFNGHEFCSKVRTV